VRGQLLCPKSGKPEFDDALGALARREVREVHRRLRTLGLCELQEWPTIRVTFLHPAFGFGPSL